MSVSSNYRKTFFLLVLTARIPGLRVVLVLALSLALAIGLTGCASTTPYTLGPIKTEDPDDRPIPAPEETEENMYWDRFDMSVLHQLEKPLNLNWTGRTLGRGLGIGSPDEADNVNVMDEPPNSSWYTRRHYYDEMTLRELAIGPNTRDTTGVQAGPEPKGTWTVTSGKLEGATGGFQIEDSRGDRYLIKLDGRDWPELMSSAEVISTKILYAAGYFVPQNTVTYFSPSQLEIGEDAMVREEGRERPMTREDLDQIVAPYERGEDGTIRGMASKFVDGRPLGPFWFEGTRDEDPNDRVRHEQRRELRGLKVISSWLNDADRRHANTMAAYMDERYVRHYLLDMGSTLGANASGIHKPIHGQAYLIDHRKIPQALLSFGAYPFPWWDYDPTPKYEAVGYFRADVFDPGDWVPTYPNPAFEKMTRRDAFWGAKIVMSFSDEDLAAIVETGRISNPEAEAHLLDLLKRRRDKIGRYWFERINPVDRFEVDAESGTALAGNGEHGSDSQFQLQFDDLAVEGNLETAAARRYTVRMYLDGEPLGPKRTVEQPELPLTSGGSGLSAVLDRMGRTSPEQRVVRIDLRTRQNGELSPLTEVYVHVPTGSVPRVVGLRRH